MNMCLTYNGLAIGGYTMVVNLEDPQRDEMSESWSSFVYYGNPIGVKVEQFVSESLVN